MNVETRQANIINVRYEEQQHYKIRVIEEFFPIRYWAKNKSLIRYWGDENAIVIRYTQFLYKNNFIRATRLKFAKV